jgi:L-fuculose-phosphate aldolase
MNIKNVHKKLSSISLSLFRKDFFGIYHGSISAKLDKSLFIINTKDAVFDDIDDKSLIELYYNKDYRWKSASLDANIHLQIYKNISDAKYISFTMPPFTTAYSLDHNIIIPKDYFGYKELRSIDIYDPKQFDDWYDRAESEIAHIFANRENDIIVIKGYGVYAYNRDLHEMAKKLAILEKSCRLLMLDNDYTMDDII